MTTRPDADRLDPCGAAPLPVPRPVMAAAGLDELRRQVRTMQRQLAAERRLTRVLRIIAGCREDERERHRAEVAALEERVADLTRHSYLDGDA